MRSMMVYLLPEGDYYWSVSDGRNVVDRGQDYDIDRAVEQAKLVMRGG